MDVRLVTLIAITAWAFAGCERSEAPPPAAPPTTPAPLEAPAEPAPAEKAVSFVNRVWVVAESKQVERGALRVFLSDGTLVMTSPNSTPAFGQWRSEGGRLGRDGGCGGSGRRRTLGPVAASQCPGRDRDQGDEAYVHVGSILPQASRLRLPVCV